MAVCDFDMHFTFAYAGWEGSAHDARVFFAALRNRSLNFSHSPEGINIFFTTIFLFSL